MNDTHTVIVQLEPAQPSAEVLADLSTLAMLFFGAAVVIVCMRALIRLFSTDSHND